MAIKEVISPRFSLQGWNLWEFLYGNKEFVKWFIPAIIGWIGTDNIAVAAIAAIVGKALLDIFEYFVKQYES